MGHSLTEIAQKLKDDKNKLQLVYAFNGTGKTRLSREFRLLVAPKDIEDEEHPGVKVLYYNAYTEDLFYWDNDLHGDLARKLIIRPNGFTNLALNFLIDQGQDGNIGSHFQRYSSPFITPRFSQNFSEVTFSLARGNDEDITNIKISKGEESSFIWCVFYSLLEQIVEVLNVAEPGDRETNQFDNLQYIFIDDPVSSLDDTHLIELAVNIAELIKSSESGLKFIITTHNPLFYNVLFNEFNRVKGTVKKRFEKLDDGTFSIVDQISDSPFAYHQFLFSELEKATLSGDIQKYHFNFVRNIFEKMSTFLGYNKWEDLLPQQSRQAYYRRIINLSSHSKHHGEESSIIEDEDKRVLRFLVNEIRTTYGFKSTINQIVIEENDTV